MKLFEKVGIGRDSWLNHWEWFFVWIEHSKYKIKFYAADSIAKHDM